MNQQIKGLAPLSVSPLQIDEAAKALGAAVAAQAAAISELLSRIRPVLAPKMIITGSFSMSGPDASAGSLVFSNKAPLAAELEAQTADIAASTKEVQEAIAALQI